MTVRSSTDGDKIAKIECQKIIAFEFSPKASFLQTFYQYTTSLPEESRANNVVWSLASSSPVHRIIHKSFAMETWPPIQWSPDEAFAARVVTNEVHIFAGDDLAGPLLHKIVLEGVRQMSWSPNPKHHRLCLFAPERKGNAGTAQIFQLPDTTAPVAKLCFFNAQDAEFSWNVYGTSLLLTTHTDVDNTGRSYYGKSTLYYLSDAQESKLIPIDGQVYSSSWKPNGRHFIVTYGYPARTTLFNLHCRPTTDFGEAPRNTTLWQPHSNLLQIAGFGSLQGDIDIWDTKELRRIGRCNAHGSKYCAWAPDGRSFLTAVISSGLRVDNGFRLWDYAGRLRFSKQLPQLDGIRWRPVSWGVYPAPLLEMTYKTEEELEAQASSTRTTASGAPASTGKYRHPNASKSTTPSVSLRNPTSVVTKYTPPQRRSEGGAGPRVPGDTGPLTGGGGGGGRGTSSSNNNNSNSRKPEQLHGSRIPGDTAPAAAPRSRAGGIPGDTGPSSSATPSGSRAQGRPAVVRGIPGDTAPSSAAGSKSADAGRGKAASRVGAPKSAEDSDENLIKRKRALTKKLRQIDLLKAQSEDGKVLLPAQLSKINAEDEILQQINDIDRQLKQK